MNRGLNMTVDGVFAVFHTCPNEVAIIALFSTSLFAPNYHKSKSSSIALLLFPSVPNSVLSISLVFRPRESAIKFSQYFFHSIPFLSPFLSFPPNFYFPFANSLEVQRRQREREKKAFPSEFFLSDFQPQTFILFVVQCPNEAEPIFICWLRWGPWTAIKWEWGLLWNFEEEMRWFSFPWFFGFSPLLFGFPPPTIELITKGSSFMPSRQPKFRQNFFREEKNCKTRDLLLLTPIPVFSLAPFHPAWKFSGNGFDERKLFPSGKSCRALHSRQRQRKACKASSLPSSLLLASLAFLFLFPRHPDTPHPINSLVPFLSTKGRIVTRSRGFLSLWSYIRPLAELPAGKERPLENKSMICGEKGKCL